MGGGEGGGGAVCGTGQGACCAGSNDGCPPEAPVCSEHGYCQCAAYQPGGAECGPGWGASGAQLPDTESGGEAVCGTGKGACCIGSNTGCPPDAPVCSEYGYCQCASYTPGGAECGPGFGSGGSGYDGASTGCGSIACGGSGVQDRSKCGGCWKR